LVSQKKIMGEKLRWDMKLSNGEPLRWDMGPQFTWDGEAPDNLNPPETMQQNDHSIEITEAMETAVLAKAEELRALVAAVTLSLTDEQRSGYFKLGDARLAFDQKCGDYIHQNPALVPTTLNVVEYDKDGANMAALDRLLAKLATINSLITDTRVVSGSDRLDADLLFYNYLEFLAQTGTAGADAIHDDLRASYPGGRRRGPTTPTNPPTP